MYHISEKNGNKYIKICVEFFYFLLHVNQEIYFKMIKKIYMEVLHILDDKMKGICFST